MEYGKNAQRNKQRNKDWKKEKKMLNNPNKRKKVKTIGNQTTQLQEQQTNVLGYFQ